MTSDAARSTNKPITQVFAAFIGGIIGVVLVRYLLLDEVQVMGWKMFWEGLAEGNLMDPGVIFESTTFWLCVGGFVLGAGIATLLHYLLTADSTKGDSGLNKKQVLIIGWIVGGVVLMLAFCGGIILIADAVDDADGRTAQMEVSQLEQMVETYYMTEGQLPDNLNQLTEGSQPITEEVPEDPWGNDYVYERHGEQEFEVFSAGPDGRAGTEDDIFGDK